MATLLGEYRDLLRSEPRARSYLLASFWSLQIGIVLLIAIAGGRRLWRFGLFADSAGPAPEPAVAMPAPVSS